MRILLVFTLVTLGTSLLGTNAHAGWFGRCVNSSRHSCNTHRVVYQQPYGVQCGFPVVTEGIIVSPCDGTASYTVQQAYTTPSALATQVEQLRQQLSDVEARLNAGGL